MVFVPDPKIINVGDVVYLTRVHRIHDGHFTIGHRFTAKKFVDTQFDGSHWVFEDSDGRQITIEKTDDAVSKTNPLSASVYYER